MVHVYDLCMEYFVLLQEHESASEDQILNVLVQSFPENQDFRMDSYFLYAHLCLEHHKAWVDF